MKNGKTIALALFTACGLIISAATGTLAQNNNSYGPAIDAFCQSNTGATPFAANSCSLCHSSIPARNAAGQAWEQSGSSPAQRDASLFCPGSPAPTCNDADGDGYGSPGDPSCPAGGMSDCNDNDPAVHPGAVENCTDGFDNNCNDLVDAQDPNAVGCPVNCSDTDGDGFFAEGGTCGPVDCNDGNFDVNPGVAEICGDGVDNNCSGVIDEGCNPACQDNDGDGYADAACGGADCNDADPSVNPGAAEVCGNGADENCNGASDDVCPTCPDGFSLKIDKAKYDLRDGELDVEGHSSPGTTVTVLDGTTGDVLGIDVKVERDGDWEWESKGFTDASAPERVEVTNSAGCAASAEVTVKNRGDHGDDEGASSGGHGDDHGSSSDEAGNDDEGEDDEGHSGADQNQHRYDYQERWRTSR